MNKIKLTQLTASLLYKNNLVIMDQTQQIPEDQQIVLYSKSVDTEDFGKLIKLPTIYGNSKNRVEKAKVYASLQLSAVRAVDIQTVGVEFMEGLLKPVNEMRNFISDAKKEVAEERKPLTKKMDAIISLFVAVENDFEALEVEAKNICNDWELEKLRRERIEKAENQKKINKSNEAVELLKNIRLSLNTNFTFILRRELNTLVQAFTCKTPSELPEFVKALVEWEPELDDDLSKEVLKIATLPAQYHTSEEYNVIFSNAWTLVEKGFNEDYATKLKEEISKLVALAPSRILELQSGDAAKANEKVESLQATSEAQINNDFANNANVINSDAEETKPTASFASTTFKKSKGTKIKQKYKIETHKALNAIIKFYVSNTLHLLTLPDAEKKFSFAITEANRQLNLGTIIEEQGLSQIDDAQTKRQ